MAYRLIIDPGGGFLSLGGGGGSLLIDDSYYNPLAEYRDLHWTDHREYRRGLKPEDWTERGGTSPIRVDGNGIDHAHKSFLYLTGEGPSRILTWDAPDADSNRANQESRCVFRVRNAVSTILSLLVLRCNDAGDTYYRLRLLWSTAQIEISKVVAGTPTVLHTYSMQLRQGAFYVARFRAETDDATSVTTLSASIVPHVLDAIDVIAWDGTTTDNTPALADGHVGVRVVSTDEIEIHEFSVATNRLTAPQAETMPAAERAPLESWIGEPGVVVELTCRVQWFNPETDAIEHEWFTSSHRSTNDGDYPPNVQFRSLLVPRADLYRVLRGSRHFGPTDNPESARSLTFDNTPIEPGDLGPLSQWSRYQFTGQPIEVRLGMRYLVEPSPDSANPIVMPHRRFECVACFTAPGEPSSNGGMIELPGQLSASAHTLLRMREMVGIATGVKPLTTSGWLSIPASPSYALTSYRISARVYVPPGGFAGTGIAEVTKLEDGTGKLSWFIGVFHASHATSPNQLRFAAHDSAGNIIIGHTAPFCTDLDGGFETDGIWLHLTFAVKGSDYWYASQGACIVGSGDLSADPIINSTNAVQCMRSAVGGILCDHRIELFLPEDEASPRMETRAEPDTYTISMHRCDEITSSATVTDYGALANHGTLQGTDAVDRSRTPTYLGSSDKAGQPMPVSRGVLYHAPAQLIDPIRNIYRYSDRSRSAGTSLVVRSRGVVVTSYTEPANEGAGTIDFTGAIDEPVTVAIDPTAGQPDNPAIHAPNVARELLTLGKVGDPSTLDYLSFDAARQIMPFKAGAYFATREIGHEILTRLVGGSGGFYDGDGHGRLAVSALLPPINPGPYGQESLLELVGVPGGGVTIPPHTSYHLRQANNRSVDAWVKFHRSPIDPSTSSTFTYFPSGFTIVDQTGDTATGFYLGIDGRDGNVIFGSPGVLGSSTGLHYIKMPYAFIPGVWYLISAFATETGGTSGERGIFIGVGLEAERSVAETTTGAVMAAPTGVPLRIGHGPRGAFVGSINTVIGASPLRSSNERHNMRTVRPPAYINPLTGDVHRFYLTLTDGGQHGITSRALEAVQNRYGYLWGARWCPRVTMDLRGYDWSSHNTGSFTHSQNSLSQSISYRTNYAPLGPSDVAATLTVAERLALAQPHLILRSVTKRPRNGAVTSLALTQSPLITHADAQAVALMVNRLSSPAYNQIRSVEIKGQLRSAGRNHQIPLPSSGPDLLRLRAGDEALLYMDHEGAQSGIPARVIEYHDEIGGDETATPAMLWMRFAI